MASPATGWSFRILGPIECYRHERRLQFSGPQQLTLLALLLVQANRAVSSDRLIDSLWGSRQPGGALKRLQVAIARLRKTLDAGGTGESPLRTVSGGYRLVIGQAELDADVFTERFADGRRALDGGDARSAAEMLDGALAMWRGPPLAEVAYEPFAQREIRRFEEMRVSALEARGEAALLLGRHAEMIAELASLVADHPTHEQFTRLLMIALYRSGRQADALAAFQRARTRMAEDLGLEPGPALTHLQAQVLAHDSALDLCTAIPSPEDEPAFLCFDDEQRVVRLDPARQITLGRNPEADVDLRWDSKVSRLHALLE